MERRVELNKHDLVHKGVILLVLTMLISAAFFVGAYTWGMISYFL